jgi:hypothetical protein
MRMPPYIPRNWSSSSDALRLGRLALLLLAALALPLRGTAVAQPPKYGPQGSPRAVPLSADHAYLTAAPALDFWALMPHYVGQMNGAACSAASVAMVLNAAVRTGRPLSNEDRNITQQVLLDRVAAEHWKARLSSLGYWGRYGLNLAQLEIVARAALQSFGASQASARAMPADGSEAGLEGFRRALVQNERSSRDAMLLHFVQDEVTAAPGGPYPHISPVGAYDEARRRVLVLDVDREWYEPYWVADDVLYRAMSKKTLAFGAGGYVQVDFGDGSRSQ